MDIFVIGEIGIVVCVILSVIFILRGTSQKGLEEKLTKYGNAVMKAQNNIINNNDEVLRETLTKYGNTVVRAQNDIINNNEDILREKANKTADIHKDAVKTIAHSIKEGLSDDNTVYCKHCGAQVDADSIFCKKCGKQI